MALPDYTRLPHPRRRTKLELLPRTFREEAENRLLTQSPSEVSVWLREIGYHVSDRSLRRYRGLFIAPKALFRGSYRVNLSRKIDALQSLYDLIQLMVERVDMGIEAERRDNVPRSSVRADMQLLQQTLIATIHLEIELGIRRKQQEKPYDFNALLERVASMQATGNAQGKHASEQDSSQINTP